MIVLVSLMTFFAVFLGIFAVNLVVTDLHQRDRQDRLEELEHEMRVRLRHKAHKESEQESEHDWNELSSLAQEETKHFSIVDHWKRLNERALQTGMETTFGTFVWISITLTVAVFLLLYVLTQNLFICAVCAGTVATLPFIFMNFKRTQRMDAMRQQLPDAMDLMSRIMRAGQTITQAMKVVGEEFKAPLGHEIAYSHEQRNLGLSQEIVLRQLADRTGLIEVRIFVLSVLIHRQTGGNLAELLDKLAKIVRQRYHVKGQIQALTAEGRFQALILLILPFAVWFGLYVINRPYAVKLLDHPTLIAITICTMAVGAVWIRKIVNFDF